jgi:hypothetical protein
LSKLHYRGFVSYAHTDTVLVERFLGLMAPRCATLREVELDQWWDERLLAGERWPSKLARALEAADFGLVCVTPAFLASVYATNVELPAFLERDRVIIPVGLEPVDFDRADLRGLEDRQVFRYRRRGEARQRWFAECAGIGQLQFCDALVGQMVDRLRSPHPARCARG